MKITKTNVRQFLKEQDCTNCGYYAFTAYKCFKVMSEPLPDIEGWFRVEYEGRLVIETHTIEHAVNVFNEL